MITAKEHINTTFSLVASMANEAINNNMLHPPEDSCDVINFYLNGGDAFENVNLHKSWYNQRSLVIYNGPKTLGIYLNIAAVHGASSIDVEDNAICPIGFGAHVTWSQRGYGDIKLSSAFQFASTLDELARFTSIILPLLEQPPTMCLLKTSTDLLREQQESTKTRYANRLSSICEALCKSMRVNGTERSIPMSLVAGIPPGNYDFALCPYGGVYRRYRAWIYYHAATFTRVA